MADTQTPQRNVLIISLRETCKTQVERNMSGFGVRAETVICSPGSSLNVGTAAH